MHLWEKKLFNFIFNIQYGCVVFFLSNILVFRCDFLVLPKKSAPKSWALATSSSSTIPPSASTLEQSMRLSLLRGPAAPHDFIGSKNAFERTSRAHHKWVGSIIILLCDGGEHPPPIPFEQRYLGESGNPFHLTGSGLGKKKSTKNRWPPKESMENKFDSPWWY